MSYLEYSVKSTPTGWRKILFIHWPLVVLLCTVAGFGFLMLYSVAGGSMDPWANNQIQRFSLGLAAMFGIAMVPIWFWRSMALVAYLFALLLLLYVEFFGVVRMGAQRWINLGFMQLQPSEVMKIALVLFLAAYYDWLPLKKTSQPFWVLLPVLAILVPTGLVVIQPDLGTSLLLMIIGAVMMFLAGVHWIYFAVVGTAAFGTVWVVLISRGTDWQILKDYQYLRVDTFLDPSSSPLGAGYNITQAKIAMGSGGLTGRGYMQGTQSRLNFLPEKHNDFIFNTLAEEFGFVGSVSLLALYMLILFFCAVAALQNKDRFSSLMILGVGTTFFLFFAVNMAMVMGLAPVVGLPLPLVSYGGTAMLVLMLAFGLVQSAHIHRPR